MRPKANVVVADGSAAERAVARRLLQADGFAVLSVGNSADLLAALQRTAPDCLLLDVDLPPAGGLFVCRQLRQGQWAELPVILVHNPDPAVRAAGLLAGASDFIARPCRRPDLLARVRSHAAAQGRITQLRVQGAALSELNRRLQSELAVARQVQQHLLPAALPSIDGLWMGALYEPAAAVSGDFYDLRLLGPGQAGILMADVEGHGVPAALVTALLKVLFHNLAAGSDDPGAILAAMNEQLATLFGGADPPAVTAVCAVFDLRAGRLRLARAGHPPAALLKGGKVALSEAPGAPLGWFAGSDYATESFPLAAGDRVLLYTDGLFEALGVGDGSGLERLTGFLRLHADASGPELLGQMGRMAHAGGRCDDLSTLLVQVGGV